jgi:hypothetical protein
LGSVVVAVVVVVLVGVVRSVPAARASYPGAVGTLAVQHSSAYTIENDNGVFSQNFSLAVQAPAGGPFSSPVSCMALDGNWPTQGDQVCPESAPSFAPDGRSLVFSGVVYQGDAGALPSQSGCQNGSPCRQTIIVAAADGSAPRPLTVALSDAEQPAFLPDGQQLIFAGAPGDGAPHDLYAVNLDGTGLQRLTTAGASEPAPCPDGSIAYVHRGDIYLRGAGGGARRLTHRGGTWPDCSHDSRTLVFDRGAALYTIAVARRGTGGAHRGERLHVAVRRDELPAAVHPPQRARRGDRPPGPRPAQRSRGDQLLPARLRARRRHPGRRWLAAIARGRLHTGVKPCTHPRDAPPRDGRAALTHDQRRPARPCGDDGLGGPSQTLPPASRRRSLTLGCETSGRRGGGVRRIVSLRRRLRQGGLNWRSC